jgi:hypothetical protein
MFAFRTLAVISTVALTLAACSGDNGDPGKAASRRFCSAARAIKRANAVPLESSPTREEQAERFVDQSDELAAVSTKSVRQALEVKSEVARAIAAGVTPTGVSSEQDEMARVTIEVTLRDCGLDGSIFGVTVKAAASSLPKE